MQSTRVQCMAVTHHWLLITTDQSHEIKRELHEAMKQQLLLYVAVNYYYFFGKIKINLNHYGCVRN